MAVKRPYKWWSNPDAFPWRVLALDTLAATERDEEGNVYTFDFIDEDKIGRQGARLWFKVSDILTTQPGPGLFDWIRNKILDSDQQSLAFYTSDRLYRVIHTEPTVAYYEEKNQDIVMAQRGRSLDFSREEVEDLADMGIGDRRVFALLALPYPFIQPPKEATMLAWLKEKGSVIGSVAGMLAAFVAALQLFVVTPMNQRFDALERHVNQRFDAQDKRIDKLEADMYRGFDRLADGLSALRELTAGISERVSRTEGEIDVIRQQLQTADNPAP